MSKREMDKNDVKRLEGHLSGSYSLCCGHVHRRPPECYLLVVTASPISSARAFGHFDGGRRQLIIRNRAYVL